MARMPDVPRATQNTFICYSKLPRDGARQPVPGGIPCFQSPAFRSFTGIASVNGRLDNDLVSIVPKVDENGGFSWEITGKKQAEAGTFSFSVTVTTKGDDRFAAVSQMFIFEVVVYRNAVPQPQTTFIQLAVGESIDTAGLIPWVVNPVIDYNVRHEGPLEDSGLYIACDKTDRGAITNVHLRGTAAKVGTYLFLTEAQTWDEGGQYDYLPSSFPAGSGSVPVVVSIYEKFDRETVIVQDPEVEYLRNPDFLRLISGGYTGSALGSFTRSGDIWSRTARELINASFNLYEVFDYQVARSGDIWQLSGRRYFSDEAPSEFEVLASASAVPGSEIPPSGTWSGGVIFVGDTWYFVEGRGFFDNKGVEGCFQGWDGSFLIADGNGGWQIDGAAVFPAELTGGTALPYSPATSEKVGKHTVRDLALESLNLNRLPDAGQLAFATGANGTAGGYWPFYPLHRQIVPPNGTDGVVAPTISGRFRIKHREETRTASGGDIYTYYASGDTWDRVNASLKEERKNNYVITISPGTLSGASRNGDLLQRLFLYNPKASGDFELDKTYDYDLALKSNGVYNDEPYSSTTTESKTERSEIIEQLSATSDLQLYLGSGRPAAGEKVQIYSTGNGQGGGSWKIRTTKTDKYISDGETLTDETTTEESTVGATGSFAARILGEGVVLPSYRTVTRSNSLRASTDGRHQEDSAWKNVVMEITITHTAMVIYENGRVNQDKSTAVTYIKKVTVTRANGADDVEQIEENTYDMDYEATAYNEAVAEVNVNVDSPESVIPDVSDSGATSGERNGNAQYSETINETESSFSP